MKFIEFANFLDKVEKENSRNSITQNLADLFRLMKPDEARLVVYMLLGRTAPVYISQEFNFSVKSIIKALAIFQGRQNSQVQEDFKKIGDLGDVAILAENIKEPSLTVLEVFDYLYKLSKSSGKNSTIEKQKIYLEVLKKSSPREVKYITRIIMGNLRVGFSLKTILDGLSIALSGDKKLRNIIEYAYGVRADIGLIAETLLRDGIESVTAFKAEAGIPVASKLVEREKSSEAIIKRMGRCYIQPKFDGLRVQLHYSKKDFNEGEVNKNLNDQGNFDLEPQKPQNVRIFSRNLENITAMLPDVSAELIKLKVDSIIMDGEAIGIDEKTGKYLPFQETIKRKRKYDIEDMIKSHPLKVNIFDVLELNGKDLTKLPLEKRLDVLKNIFNDIDSRILTITKTDLVEDSEKLESLFNDYTKDNLEGIIAKTVDGSYEPGTRNFEWIKLKASSKSEMVDSVDAVIMGYFKGGGSRAEFGLGAILLGVYDKNSDKYLSLAKVGTGITEAQLKSYKAEIDKHLINEIPKNYSIAKNLLPDVIALPRIVVTIDSDSISKSKDKDGCGYSLRFPRLTVFNRDKDPQDTTSIEELARMMELKIN